MNDLINNITNNISSAIQTATDTFYKREEQKIEKSKELQLDFLERERERVLATAQSEEERASINRKFDKQNEEAEKKAAEKRKKLALKQLTIDFAIAAVKTFAQFGWPLGLVAVAGLTAAYFAQRASIQNQEFAKGGQVQPAGNGRVRTSPNIRRKPNGDNVVATLKVGEVVLNEEQQRRLGGARTFRRIGVPGFAVGGQVRPQLGTDLPVPTFNSGFYSSGVNQNSMESERLNKLESVSANLMNAIAAEASKTVVVSSRRITESQDRTKKDVSVATI